MAQVSDRLRLTLPLLLPCLGGLWYLYVYDAPARLIAVNAGALAAALMWVLLGRLPSGRYARLALAMAAALALFAPPVLGPEVGGVARWIPAGPMRLHSGALLLPLLTVLAAQERIAGPALFAVAGAALALQPDAAALAGLAAAAGVLALSHRSVGFALVAIAALGGSMLTFGAGTLEPQVFTEGVLAHVAGHSMAQALAMGALLLAGPLWFLVLRPHTDRVESSAMAAVMLGLAAVAVVAPFPFPLIGYGAAPILGFGLALGTLWPSRSMRPQA